MTRLRRVARSGLTRLPQGARLWFLQRLSPAWGRRLGLRSLETGLVSLVVVCEPGDEPRLDQCLASVLDQWHPLLDVLLCLVDGSAPEVPPDPRIRTLPAQESWQTAANLGMDHAAGRFVWLVRACDTLTPHAVTDLAGSLARSGSDLAVGRLTQSGLSERWLERQQDCHGAAGTALGPDTRPGLVGDLALGNKLVRTSFWRSAGLRLGARDEWLMAPTLARALARDPRVDVLDAPVLLYAHDRGRRAFGDEPSPLPELPDWERGDELVREELAGTPWQDGWSHHVLDVALPRFLRDAERADDEQWSSLVELVRQTSTGTPVDRGPVRAESRTLAWLGANDRRNDLEALAAELTGLGDDVPTRVEQGRVYADWSSTRGRTPDELLRMDEAETPLLASAQRRFGRGEDIVDVFVRVQHVDLSAAPPAVTADLADGTPVRVEPRPDRTANRWAQARFASAAEGSVRLHLPAGTDAGPVEVDLVLEVAGLVRRGTVPLPARPKGRVGAGDDEVVGIELQGDELVVRTSGPSSGLRLVGPDAQIEGQRAADGEVRFATTSRLFGRPTWLPSGRYELTGPGRVRLSAELADALPIDSLGSRHRLRMTPGADGSPAFHLGPPLADDELGAYGREQLRRAYRARVGPTEPDLVYCESYAGSSATDSPLPVLGELMRRRPGIRAFWGVRDHGQWVPDGVEPVVIGTAAWYSVLARARVLITNTELEGWYQRRPDQLVVQTFHGYPSKAMGAVQWHGRHLPPSRVREMQARSVDTWDLILTPTPAMTRHYREQYSYTGAVHERGYPRNDVLTGDEAVARRRETRALLGIGEHETAVLYAPTWREHLAVRHRAAAMTDYLDLARAAELLGTSHVLLVRGHRFHSPSTHPSRLGSARIVDVTQHPEVNDLILGSDAAVLDYSSLRFDYALTGKPMVFLVPDLEVYSGEMRGFLFPFEETTPGPLVASTDEVVDEVRDVAALGARWQEALVRFNQTYNPWQDEKASQRVADQVLAVLGGQPPG